MKYKNANRKQKKIEEQKKNNNRERKKKKRRKKNRAKTILKQENKFQMLLENAYKKTKRKPSLKKITTKKIQV